MFNGLKYISLFVLVIQNCWLAFVMKFSKSNDGPEYNSKTAVILSEFLKLVLSILVLTTTNKFSSRRELVKELKKDSLKLMVPTVLYLLQNNLQYYAVSKLDPTLFQITYQIKIFTTAFFSMLILKKKLNFNQIVALIVLMIGVVLVQFDDDEVGEESLIKNLNNSSDFWNFNDRFLGLIAVLVSCILSGLAGVWFEMVLKNSDTSLWVRNTQLAFYSLILGLGSGFIMDEEISKNGFFYGYTKWTFSAILTQASGGLLVALVVKYADNILKGFATSISIILSTGISIVYFDFKITTSFVLGSFLVTTSTILYSLADFRRTKIKSEDPLFFEKEYNNGRSLPTFNKYTLEESLKVR